MKKDVEDEDEDEEDKIRCLRKIEGSINDKEDAGK